MIQTIALSLAMLCPVSSPAPSADLTRETKVSTLNNLIREMNENYVFPDVAKKIERRLQDWMKTPEFEDANEPTAFASLVNATLKKEVTDAHLRFRYSAAPLPVRTNPGEPSANELKRYKEETRFMNSGFTKVERLRGNIGYVSFVGFWSPEDMARPVEGAMRFLADVDAFIVDLRENGGGDPKGVQLFCSYFFDSKPVHLNDILYRNGDKTTTTEYWTLKKVAGPRLPKVPLYVLTSKRTGSGAEECAYNFQQLKRGTIIGESTWGGANPGGRIRLDDHFDCFIPVGMARNPYTKTNWEGTGVSPDIKVAPTDALKKAHTMSLEKLIETTVDPERKDDLMKILEEVVKGA